MNLTVRNIGRIESAEFDIKPLTVFIGPNGTNKTWVATALYGLLREVCWWNGTHDPSVRRFFGNDEREISRRLKVALEPTMAALSAKSPTDRVQGVIDIDALLFGLSQPATLEGNSDFFAAMLKTKLPRSPYARLRLPRGAFPSRTSRVKLEVDHRKRTVVATSLPAAMEEEPSTTVTFGEEGPAAHVQQICERALWEILRLGIFFPADRKSLVESQDVYDEEFRKSTNVPAEDFLAWLDVVRGQERCESAEAAIIEKLAGGRIDYSSRDTGGRLMLQLADGTDLPLQAASSLARSIAPLRLFFELAVEGEVLFIDELEMNAHPAAQLILTELVTQSVNAGVRVIFTTHSPYIVDHLNALMTASRLASQAAAAFAGRFALKTADAFIAPDRVAAYHFGEDGKVTDILDPTEGQIDWETFSQVSDEAANLDLALHAALEGHT